MNLFNKIFKKPKGYKLKSQIINEVSSRTEWRTPSNYGWLKCKLNQKELDYVWECVNSKKNNVNETLAGNISNSYALVDKNAWFFKNTLLSLLCIYEDQFTKDGFGYPQDTLSKNNTYRGIYELSTWWVNYQKQHEFNPIHDHTGVYSFVIWLKIPTEFEEQNRDETNNSPEKSAFSFVYHNILGQIKTELFPLGKEYEGTIVFFPSTLKHFVQPFYNCTEDRISVSGNIALTFDRLPNYHISH